MMPPTRRQAVPLPVRRPAVEARLRATLGLTARAYTMGPCPILVSEGPAGWHLPISCPDRYPTWDEIQTARDALLPPRIDVVLRLPPLVESVNLHEICFHLYEYPPRA